MNIIKPLDQHVVNILSVYARADLKDIQQGEFAYDEYNRVIDLMLTDAGISCENEEQHDEHLVLLEKMCGVFAALSPNATYTSNVSSAKSMLEVYLRRGDISEAKVSTYSTNKMKAWTILHSPVEYVQGGTWTKGKKTYAFYRNLWGPGDVSAPVVVDGHMYSIWQLKAVRMNEAKIGNGKRYDRISDDVKTAARIVGVSPSVMQATCWFTWKRVNRISFDVRELQPRLWVEACE